MDGMASGGTNEPLAPCKGERADDEVQRRPHLRPPDKRLRFGRAPAQTLTLAIAKPVGDPLLRDDIGGEHRPLLPSDETVGGSATRVCTGRHFSLVTSITNQDVPSVSRHYLEEGSVAAVGCLTGCLTPIHPCSHPS